MKYATSANGMYLERDSRECAFFGMVVPDDGKRYCLVLGVPRSLGAPDLLYLLRYAYVIYTYMVIPVKIDTRIVMNDIPTQKDLGWLVLACW